MVMVILNVSVQLTIYTQGSKLRSVRHVQKRVGNRLHNLKKAVKRVTDDIIDKLLWYSHL